MVVYQINPNTTGAQPTGGYIYPASMIDHPVGNRILSFNGVPICADPPIYKEPEAVKHMAQFVVAKYSDDSKAYERTTIQVSVSLGQSPPVVGSYAPAALLTETEQEEIAALVAKKLGLKFLGKA